MRLDHQKQRSRMKLAEHQWQAACENTLTHQRHRNLHHLINLVFHGIERAYGGNWFGRNIKNMGHAIWNKVFDEKQGDRQASLALH